MPMPNGGAVHGRRVNYRPDSRHHSRPWCRFRGLPVEKPFQAPKPGVLLVRIRDPRQSRTLTYDEQC